MEELLGRCEIVQIRVRLRQLGGHELVGVEAVLDDALMNLLAPGERSGVATDSKEVVGLQRREGPPHSHLICAFSNNRPRMNKKGGNFQIKTGFLEKILNKDSSSPINSRMILDPYLEFSPKKMGEITGSRSPSPQIIA